MKIQGNRYPEIRSKIHKITENTGNPIRPSLKQSKRSNFKKRCFFKLKKYWMKGNGKKTQKVRVQGDPWSPKNELLVAVPI